MMGFNPGAFVQGHQAGVQQSLQQEEMAMKQEQLAMQKKQFYLQAQQTKQELQKGDYVLAQMEELKQANQRLKADFFRQEVNDTLRDAIKASSPQELDIALEKINNSELMKGKTVRSLTEADSDKAVKYVQSKGWGNKPYIMKDGKAVAPNELDPMEVSQALKNAQALDSQMALGLIGAGQLVVNSDGAVVGLEDIAAITGHFAKYPSSQKINDEILLGIREKLKTEKPGEFKAQSKAGKILSDAEKLGLKPEDLAQIEQTMDLPEYSQAIKNLSQKGVALTQDNINREVQSIKGTIPQPQREPREPKEPETALSSYSKMVNLVDKAGLNPNAPDFAAKVNKLSTVDKGALQASAKEYFKESGEKLVDTSIIGKHIHTIRNLDMGALEMDKASKDATGLADTAINSVKRFFTSSEGIEFKKKTQQTFNSLLGTSTKGHISQAELDNLTEAFGSFKDSDEVAFSNFKSMVVAMKSQVDAYKQTSAVAGEILYGDLMTGYDKLMDVINTVEGGYKNLGSQSNAINVVDSSGTKKSYSFGGE